MTTTSNPFSLTNLDPSQWTVVGYFYQGSSSDLAEVYEADHKQLNLDLAQMGKSWDDIRFHGNGGCAHCGAHFAHGAVAAHTDGTLLAIGHTCAAERFGLNTKGELADKYGKAKLVRERMARAERFAKLCMAHEGLEQALELQHRILADIRSRAIKYGELSERQIALVFKIAAELTAPKVERPTAPCPSGRIVIEGVVTSRSSRMTDFGMQYRMTILDDRGFKVNGTEPGSLQVATGDRVRLTATVEPKEQGGDFGFYKRPTKAEVLS